MSNNDAFGLRGPYLSKDCDFEGASLKDTAVALVASVRAVPKYTQAYRLEAKFDVGGSKASVKVAVKPTLWYDAQLRRFPKKKVVHASREWISRTHEEVPITEDGPSFIEYDTPLPESSFSVFKYHCKTNGCSSPTCGLSQELEERHVAREACCNFFFVDSLRPDKLQAGKQYAVILRREPQRELMITPHPGNDHMGHRTNEELVGDQKFWDSKEFRCSAMALNFGLWESLHSESKYQQSCHAHVHLSDWLKLQQLDMKVNIPHRKGKNAKLYSADALLTGRNAPPASYKMQDCHELERERLVAAGTELLPEEIADHVAAALKSPFDNTSAILDKLTSKA